MIRSRLFLKIYLTLLACLAAVAMASAIYWRVSADRDELGWSERRDQFVEGMLPASDGPADWQRTLDRFADALDAGLALYAPDGRLIAASGEQPPPPDEQGRDSSRRPDHRGVQKVRLSDGRVLVADFDTPWQGRSRYALGYLVLIAAVVGAAGYPVVRHLTRRLESLRDGVERFGSGTLAARVPVEGKDEIAAVAGSFNLAAERVERLVNAHRSLLANASHELRSPLTRLRMAIDLYGTRASAEQSREILDNLHEMDELVEEILLASRLEHVGKLENSVPVDFTALVAEECARQAIETTGSRAEVSGDARLLARLVRNLLANAARHGRPPIEAQVRAKGPVVKLTIRDHGDGIPAGEEKHIFEPFYRPAGRSEAAGGWGLGLALVKQIAELHDGRVHCESPPDGGARFVVELPLLRV